MSKIQEYLIRLAHENCIVRFVKYVSTWSDHRRVIKELNLLSDRELNDIGISRYQIDSLLFRKSDRELRQHLYNFEKEN